MKRTWPQRLLIAFNCILVVVCLASAWTLAYSEQQIGRIPRVALRGVLDLQEDPTKPVNILMLGADSLGDPDPNAPGSAERAGTVHADSLSILRLDPGRQQALMLSLPRDLWVTPPGGGTEMKLGETMNGKGDHGDPQRLIQTIQNNFHVPVNYFVQVDFAAFRGLVDLLDGVNLWFDAPARDKHSDLAVYESGCQHLTGYQALAYARSRYYEQWQPDGSYVFDGTGDLGRIARQQYFLKQVGKRAIAQGARNPVQLTSLLDNALGQKWATFDDVLTPQKIIDLVGHFSSFNPDDLEVVQPPNVREIHQRAGGGGDGQRLQVAASQPIFDRFRDQPTTPTTTAPPGTTPPVAAAGADGTTTTTPVAPAGSQPFVPHPPPGTNC